MTKKTNISDKQLWQAFKQQKHDNHNQEPDFNDLAAIAETENLIEEPMYEKQLAELKSRVQFMVANETTPIKFGIFSTAQKTENERAKLKAAANENRWQNRFGIKPLYGAVAAALIMTAVLGIHQIQVYQNHKGQDHALATLDPIAGDFLFVMKEALSVKHET